MNANEYANQIAEKKHQERIRWAKASVAEREIEIETVKAKLEMSQQRLASIESAKLTPIRLTPKMIYIVEQMLAGVKLADYRTFKHGLSNLKYKLCNSDKSWEHETVRADLVEALLNYGVIIRTRNSESRCDVYSLAEGVSNA